MASHKKKNIDWVVESGLCTSCGTCVAVCPQDAISMVESPSGFLFARVDTEKCNLCGICSKVCPGWHLKSGALSGDINPFKGKVLAAYVGQATEKDMLLGGQSGGITSALLCYLINIGQIDKAVVTKIPEDGSLRSKVIITGDKEEILKSRGSKYCPVALNAVFAGKAQGERLAVVGLGCHFHGIHNAQDCQYSRFPDVALKIGLFCQGTLTYGVIDYLIEKAGLSNDEVIGFEFRNKKWRGFPGDVCIHTEAQEKHYVSNTYRKECKDVFTPLRCRLCFEKFNVLSDIASGDAYGFTRDKLGASTILVRTQKGLNILSAAQQAGVIKLDAVSPDAIFKAQAIERCRKDYTGYTIIWQEDGFSAPQFGIEKKWYAKVNNKSLRNYRRQTKRLNRVLSKQSRKGALRAAKRYILFARIKYILSAPKIITFVLRRVRFSFFHK